MFRRLTSGIRKIFSKDKFQVNLPKEVRDTLIFVSIGSVILYTVTRYKRS